MPTIIKLTNTGKNSMSTLNSSGNANLNTSRLTANLAEYSKYFSSETQEQKHPIPIVQLIEEVY